MFYQSKIMIFSTLVSNTMLCRTSLINKDQNMSHKFEFGCRQHGHILLACIGLVFMNIFSFGERILPDYHTHAGLAINFSGQWTTRTLDHQLWKTGGPAKFLVQCNIKLGQQNMHTAIKNIKKNLTCDCHMH